MGATFYIGVVSEENREVDGERKFALDEMRHVHFGAIRCSGIIRAARNSSALSGKSGSGSAW
jgi:hypothetical protein